MDKQFYSFELERSRKVIKVDAILFAIFGALFLLLSLASWNIEITLWFGFFYLPFLIPSFLGFVCSKTNSKSCLQCYSIILVIIAIYLGLLGNIASFSLVKNWIEIINDECIEEESCVLKQDNKYAFAIVSLIFWVLLILCCVLAIYAYKHSGKVKDLLSDNMRSLQDSLIKKQEVFLITPVYMQQQWTITL